MQLDVGNEPCCTAGCISKPYLSQQIKKKIILANFTKKNFDQSKSEKKIDQRKSKEKKISFAKIRTTPPIWFMVYP